MKRVGIFLSLVLVFVLSGCMKGTKEAKAKSEFINQIEESSSYELKADLDVIKNTSTVSFDMEVLYQAPALFKVTYTNSANNSRQVLLKNTDGVYVLSPELNKEFKFESTWPLNSSHIYILNKIATDLNDDDTSTISSDDNHYVIKSSISHKIRKDLVSQTIYLSKKDYSLSKITFDTAEKSVMTLVVNELNFNVNLKSDAFNVNAIMDSETSLIGEGDLTIINEVLFKDIFEGVSLTASSKTDDYTILTYSGAKMYNIIYQDVYVTDVSTSTRIYDDFVMLDEGLGFVSSNSLTFYKGNKEFKIISSSLELSEMIQLANSLEVK